MAGFTTIYSVPFPFLICCCFNLFVKLRFILSFVPVLLIFPLKTECFREENKFVGIFLLETVEGAATQIHL
jgi:hypothetical protein